MAPLSQTSAHGRVLFSLLVCLHGFAQRGQKVIIFSDCFFDQIDNLATDAVNLTIISTGAIAPRPVALKHHKHMLLLELQGFDLLASPSLSEMVAHRITRWNGPHRIRARVEQMTVIRKRSLLKHGLKDENGAASIRPKEPAPGMSFRVSQSSGRGRSSFREEGLGERA